MWKYKHKSYQKIEIIWKWTLPQDSTIEKKWLRIPTPIPLIILGLKMKYAQTKEAT